MDTAADQDLQLQKSSPELIAEFSKSLPRFLRRAKVGGRVSTSESPGPLRRLVRQSKTDQLIKLLEPFQEWPQLLDPHLSALLQPLVFAFIEYLSNHASDYHKSTSHLSPGVIPLPRAICIILYVFCKIRGQKVIVRFLSNEPQYLEPMLDALESWARPERSDAAEPLQIHASMVWQESFIMLWWLSHLMLVPFNLTSMSSEKCGVALGDSWLCPTLPHGTPPIARRLLHVSTFYLSFASKEREAAGMLLARLALKPDLQLIELQSLLIQRALSTLHEIQANTSPSISTHAIIGLLSFLNRFTTSAEYTMLQPLFPSIYQLVNNVRSSEASFPSAITSLTLARKLVIKISRAVAVASIKIGTKGAGFYPEWGQDALENLIDHLLAALEDRDTTVRVAASKALSLIVLELDSDLAGQVISNLITDLRADIRYLENPQTGRVIDGLDPSEAAVESIWVRPMSVTRNFAAVEPAKWHGLVFTLGHLIYRRAIPANGLFTLIEGMLSALQFEQRSPVGATVGTNVRDAACFGLWSLARRYTTDEISEIMSLKLKLGAESMLQPSANNLVVAATLDPAGNIRRGASAALQEMIGRHPDVIIHGIRLVQVVDYHAIALRSSAMLEVAVNASEIDETYWNAVLDGLLGWRGLRSPDARSRRQAAEALGCLTLNSGHSRRQVIPFILVRDRLAKTSFHEFEERHGLLLAWAHIIMAMHKVCETGDSEHYHLPQNETLGLWDTLMSIFKMNDATFTNDNFGPQVGVKFIFEGVCRLISAIILSFSDPSTPTWFKIILEPTPRSKQFCLDFLDICLYQTDSAVVEVAAEAAANVFLLHNRTVQQDRVSDWIDILDSTNPNSRQNLIGFIAALGSVFKHMGDNCIEGASMSDHDSVMQWLEVSQSQPSVDSSQMQHLTLEKLCEQITTECDIEVRCAALKWMTFGILRYQMVTDDPLEKVRDSLDDYTINHNGDVGSLVRIEAIDAAATILDWSRLSIDDKQHFVAKIGGLSVEKLDKVRWKAWYRLQPRLLEIGFDKKQLLDTLNITQTSSIAYFKQLLFLTSLEWARKSFLEGYVTSAGAGSESLRQATRAAFVMYTETITPQESHDLCISVAELCVDNLNNDRLSIPTMEFLLFLLDSNMIQFHSSEEAWWRRFFNLLQQAHYKSSNIPKIEAAVKLYAALAIFAPMRRLVLKKLCQMLVHPFTKVRNTVAESVSIVTEDLNMTATNWSSPPKELRGAVEELKFRLGI